MQKEETKDRVFLCPQSQNVHLYYNFKENIIEALDLKKDSRSGFIVLIACACGPAISYMLKYLSERLDMMFRMNQDMWIRIFVLVLGFFCAGIG